MPTVLDSGGFSIRVFTDDHEPAHVHVYRGDAVVRILLKPTVQYHSHVGKIKKSDARRAVALVAQHVDACFRIWKEYHGGDNLEG